MAGTSLIIPKDVQVLANFHESSLGVEVLGNNSVIHCFELQIFGGS